MAHKDTGKTPAPKLDFHEVDTSRWKDLEQLFEARGGPSYCWCMAYRVTTEEKKHSDRASRKAMLHARVKAGTPVGLLGYEDGEPVAWCSLAPRESFKGLVSGDADEARVWSISCFFVIRRLRGQGVNTQLLEAATKCARRHGAKVIEGYPVDHDSPSYRHMGQLPLFTNAGFKETGREGKRRHVVRRALRRKTG